MALPVHTGKVQYVSRSHGFLEWQANGENQPRIYYQAFDVEGNVELSKGDEITFTIADKVLEGPHPHFCAWQLHSQPTALIGFTQISLLSGLRTDRPRSVIIHAVFMCTM